MYTKPHKSQFLEEVMKNLDVFCRSPTQAEEMNKFFIRFLR